MTTRLCDSRTESDSDVANANARSIRRMPRAGADSRSTLSMSAGVASAPPLRRAHSTWSITITAEV